MEIVPLTIADDDTEKHCSFKIQWSSNSIHKFYAMTKTVFIFVINMQQQLTSEQADRIFRQSEHSAFTLVFNVYVDNIQLQVTC